MGVLVEETAVAVSVGGSEVWVGDGVNVAVAGGRVGVLSAGNEGK